MAAETDRGQTARIAGLARRATPAKHAPRYSRPRTVSAERKNTYAAPTPAEVMGDQPAAGLPFVLLVGVLAGLALVAFTALPEALSARRPAPAVRAFRVHEERGG